VRPGGGPLWGFTVPNLPYPTGAGDPGVESAASPGKESMQSQAMTLNPQSKSNTVGAGRRMERGQGGIGIGVGQIRDLSVFARECAVAG